jgi:hypothetical protein
MRHRLFVVGIAFLAIGLLHPWLALAQGDRASIVGVVQDASGAVLPGVTVEVSSPALIERVRTGVTDSSGRYAIVDLRPGTYSVTFSLTGFNTVRREGILLEGAFAAQVNGSLAVGSLEETITVTGASPVVDLQSTRNQFVANQAILEALPVSRTLNGGMSLVPGVNSYNNAAGSSAGQIISDLYINTATVHGSTTSDQHTYVDGMNVAQMLLGAGGQIAANPPNDLGFAEVVYDVGAQSAETPNAGVRSDVIPKEGGNVFAGTYRAFGSNQSLQADNLTSELAAFITNPSRAKFNWESNVALGGPILQNKLWYFGAFKLTQAVILMTNQFYPDGRPVDNGGHVNPNMTLRLTYQMTPKTKLRLSGNNGTVITERWDVTGQTAPEAGLWLATPLNYSAIAKATSVRTNRLMVEVGQSLAATTYQYHYQPEVGPFDLSRREATTGRTWGAYTSPTNYFDTIWHTTATVNYVTGTHALKVGSSVEHGWQKQDYYNNGDVQLLTFLSGNASSISVRNTPITKYEDVNAILGLYVQDRWTVNRLTLNGGLRFDYINASVPEQTNHAGNFVQARQSDPISCLPCWTDWSIRAGAAYDLFGTGKTALKASFGKFVASTSAGIASSTNPMAPQTDSRNWTDRDNNGSALDANGRVQYDEIGQSRNANFGVPRGSTKFDPNTPRPTNWEENVSLVQELWSGVSLTAAYYHRHFFDMQLTRNLAVDPDRDWTTYTIVSPLDGERITMYNLNPTKLGAVDSVSTFSTRNTREYHGFEVSMNARLPRGGFAFGSVTTDRLATNDCEVENSDPNGLRFCERVPPFRGLYKASAGYPLPYDVQLSATFQLRPGNPISANYTFNSAIAGVALTGGGNRTVNLVDPTTLFYDYTTQLDIRAARTFRFGRRRLQAFVEVFNLPNVSTVLTVNTTYGNQWRNPLLIEQPRRFQIGGQFDF